MARRRQTDRRRPGNPQFDRKIAQLCRQAERRLTLAFAELEDDALAELILLRVEASPDGARLRLVLCRSVAPSGAGPRPSERELRERLGRHMGRLREEVAAAIHRRRTPSLDFALVDPPTPS